MSIILDIGVFALVIGCSFFVGSMFASKYIIHLLNNEGYHKVDNKTYEEDSIGG